MAKFRVDHFDPRIQEMARRADEHDHGALDALTASLDGKVRAAKMQDDKPGLPKSSGVKSKEQQGIAGTYDVAQKKYDLSDPASCKEALDDGAIDLKQYRAALEEIAKRAEAEADELDEDSDDGDSDDGSDDGGPAREHAPGPSVPARKTMADARHFDRQVRKTMRDIGANPHTQAARNNRFNAMITAGYTPAMARTVIQESER